MLTDSTCRMNINILLKVFHGRRVTCHIGTNRQIKSTQQKKNDHNIGFDFHGELNQFHVLPKETVGRVKAVLVEMYFNDEKEYNDKQDDDKKRWQQKNTTMYINL